MKKRILLILALGVSFTPAALAGTGQKGSSAIAPEAKYCEFGTRKADDSQNFGNTGNGNFNSDASAAGANVQGR